MFLEEKEKFVVEPLKAARAEPFSLESLIAWLETKPGDTAYCFTQAGDCLWAKYTADNAGKLDWSDAAYHIGAHTLSVMSSVWHDNGEKWRAEVAQGYPRTFETALTLARSYQANAKRSGS